MSNEIYIYVNLDKLIGSPDHPVVAARKIIDKAFLGGVPKDDDRGLYNDNGDQCGYMGSIDREKEETRSEAAYRSEREKNTLLRAEIKGLREALKEASRPPGEQMEALSQKLAEADHHARLILQALS